MNVLNENIEKLKLGDEDAFEYIFSYLESPLLNHLNKMLGSMEKSEEVFQETMMKIIQKINFYEHQPQFKNSFKSWAFRVATNCAIDDLRKMKKELLEYEQDYVSDIADFVIDRDLAVKLSELIMELPLIQRTFLNLKVNEDLSHLEIANICGQNINSVKQGLFRARRNLKSLIIREGINL